MNHRLSVACAALALVGAIHPAAGQTRAGVTGDTVRLTLPEARRLALAHNPTFLSEREERDIAAGELRQARTYPYNPQAEFEAPSPFRQSGLGRYQAMISQEIEWAGQRGLRIGAAEGATSRAEFTVADAARRTLADVGVAFYTTLAARQRLAVAVDLLGLNERLIRAVRTQVGEGEISVMEANLAEIEVGRARARVLAGRREATTAALELGRLIGLGPDVTLAIEAPAPPSEPGRLEPDSLLAAALEARPDLAARKASVRQAETSARLARREAIPNLRIIGLVERETALGESRFGLGIGLPLPLWNRTQGLIAERDALARQRVLSRQALELAVRIEVEDAYLAWIAATEEARIFEEDVLEPARRNQDLLETAYTAGKIDLAALVLLRNQLLDAEIGYWDAWLAHQNARVRLEAVTGALRMDTSNEGSR